jgi:hypothetical protein
MDLHWYTPRLLRPLGLPLHGPPITRAAMLAPHRANMGYGQSRSTTLRIDFADGGRSVLGGDRQFFFPRFQWRLRLKFTLLISASSRTFSRRQSQAAAIELFTAAATFSVLIHLLTQVRGGIGQDSGRVLTRTLGVYFSGVDPRILITDWSSWTFIDIHLGYSDL